ncbi:MAG: ImmA/IrrE family metallo-endopeptidase [Saprospiraceae bacterium]|nr:ImmA/IrrE family metallo-endopeptidase [Saprospiraceae bacterium]
MSATIQIPPSRFHWAIARAGFDFDEFLRKNERVKSWVDNKAQPTVRQLEDFAKKVYIPFGYLFLPEPPKEQMPIPFFRTGKHNEKEEVSLNVRDTVSLLKYRQDWLSEYLAEQEEAALPFVGKFGLGDAPEAIASDMRQVLGLEGGWASHQANWTDAKTLLTRKIEDLGIVVVFNSIVENNTHRKLEVKECRGFVLVDAYVPFLFVNNADSKSAQMFTLAHELAHVWTGKSAGFDAQKMLPANDPMEQLCDQVAAGFLAPPLFTEFWKEKPDIFSAARHFKVSPIVAARRALDLGFMTKPEYFGFYRNYIAEEHHKKLHQSQGGDGLSNLKVRIGLPFMARLNAALKNGQISYKDAYRLSGLKGETYQKLVNKLHL